MVSLRGGSAMSGLDRSWPGTSWYSGEAGPFASPGSLRERKRCRVAIVGGGLAGVSTAV
ncbi:MAG: hypothetical protein V2J10_04035 [Wenzhouxiangella sp.]|nr:hypothetical protein [Wenzhouxiangella sp.]